MENFALERQAEGQTSPTVKVMQKQEAEESSPMACRSGVLLDGGASHHVYYSSEIPEGSIRKQVELAHGTKTGFVRGEDMIFLIRKEARRIQKGLRYLVLVD